MTLKIAKAFKRVHESDLTPAADTQVQILAVGADISKKRVLDILTIFPHAKAADGHEIWNDLERAAQGPEALQQIRTQVLECNAA